MVLRVIGDGLRAIFLSWEFVAIAAVIALWHIAPEIPELVGVRVKSDQKLWDWMLAVPAAVLVWSAVEAKSVLFPASAQLNRKLREWADYWRLKMRVLIGLFWGGLSVVVSVCIWIFKSDAPAVIIGSAFIAALGISIVAAASLWFAGVRVREIVER